MPITLKAVFFDIDGTLVDSNEFHVTAWEKAFRDCEHPVPVAAIRGQIGKGADMLIPALLPESDDTTRASIAQRHDEIFKSRYLEQVQAFPGATELIATMYRDGIKVLLASSAKADEVEHYVKLLRAKQFLTATTSSDDVHQSKPAADIFASALKKVAPIDAQEAIAVGDTPYDVTSAGKCRIRTVAVLSGGFPEAELQRAGAIAIYDTIADLLVNLETSPLASHRK
jgi:phosphoglycolate phosphatase-like HAD superfamily hydrolase